jgi:hypothetical protein
VNASTFEASQYTVLLGENVHTLTPPFEWDGIRNICIDITNNNTNFTSNGNAGVLQQQGTTLSPNSILYYVADGVFNVETFTGTGILSKNKFVTKLNFEKLGFDTDDLYELTIKSIFVIKFELQILLSFS